MLTPAAEGMDGAVRKAEQLQQAHPGSLIPDQFGNPANAMAHEKTTAPEILRDLDGEVDFFVSAVGTGSRSSSMVKPAPIRLLRIWEKVRWYLRMPSISQETVRPPGLP